MMKFLTKDGMGEVHGVQILMRECYMSSLRGRKEEVMTAERYTSLQKELSSPIGVIDHTIETRNEWNLK